MSDPHLACYQLEDRLRHKIDQLETQIAGLKDDMRDLEVELEDERYESYRTRLGIREAAQAGEDYRRALETLDNEIATAEQQALTAKVFNNTPDHPQQWHEAYIAGLRHAAKLLAP